MDHATRYQNRPAQSLRPGEQPRAPGRTGVPAVCPRGAACEEEQRHDLHYPSDRAVVGSSPSRLPIRRPSVSMVASSAQCPNITTTSAASRTTSTARSRADGVSSATLRASDMGLVSGKRSGCRAAGHRG